MQTNKPQSHGLSQQEMADLHQQQISGEAPKTVKGNKDSSYEVAEHEKHLVHARLTVVGFDPTTGAPTGAPSIQKFHEKEFDRMEAEGAFKGYSVEVLHDPRKKAAALEGKIEAGIESPIVSPNLDKPIDELTEDELKLKYAELFKEEAPAKLKGQALRDAIEDQIIALRSASHEITPADVSNASNPAQGDLKDGVRTGAAAPKEDAKSKGK